ncbi:MAG: winged helix-turn-helix transcriptional regulator [Clostridia bacterium]|nr:winged helix-turn-helix transcriptional regulator [Clostridia bacterium]
MDNLPVCERDVLHEETIARVQKALLPPETYLDLAALFKLLGDGTRVKLLCALAQHEMCVCDLAALLGLTKSAVSHQLKALRLMRLVTFRREAQTVYYSLSDDHVRQLVDVGLEHLTE